MLGLTSEPGGFPMQWSMVIGILVSFGLAGYLLGAGVLAGTPYKMEATDTLLSPPLTSAGMVKPGR